MFKAKHFPLGPGEILLYFRTVCRTFRETFLSLWLRSALRFCVSRRNKQGQKAWAYQGPRANSNMVKRKANGNSVRMVPPGMEVIHSTESLLQDAELISLMNKSLGKNPASKTTSMKVSDPLPSSLL